MNISDCEVTVVATAGSWLLFVVAFVLAISNGSASLTQIADYETLRTILVDIRLPRVVVGALCGGALAAAGVLSQGLFRNSLASPSILGTSAGGATAATIVFYMGWHTHSLLALPLAAFLGALGATLLILWLCSRPEGRTLEHVLLAGFTLNALLGALTSLVISLTLEDFQRAPAIISWLMGSLSGRGWDHVAVATLPLAVGWVLAARLARPLDLICFGEEVAASLSLDVARFKFIVIAVMALLVGVAVSVAGALPFVGLIVPHLTRFIAGPHHGRLLRLSTLNGASLVLLADLAARTIRAPQELEVGILITLIGAPFFAYLLVRHARSQAT